MIFCFSGTGNSRWVAQQLARQLNDYVIDINDNPINWHYVETSGRVIWVFPVYSWGLPPIVKQFMANGSLDFDGFQIHHYMVCTCGDDIGLAHKQWLKLIKKRRWRGRAMFSVQMPNTYTLMKGFDVDSPETVQQKLSAATGRINHIAQQIHQDRLENGITIDVTSGSWAWIKTRIIYPYFMRFCMSPKPFHATNDCIGCGKCSRQCPLLNINMTNDRPQWGDKCTMCLRCYHTCPQHAVAYGKATRYKGQYLCPLNGK